MQKRALIIDDEEEICKLFAVYLEKKNIPSFYALNLNEGLSKFEKYLPDYVFLDNNLPDGLGISLIKKFKEINPSSKIIVISAISDLAETAIIEGATGFVDKPISFQTIDKFII